MRRAYRLILIAIMSGTVGGIVGALIVWSGIV